MHFYCCQLILKDVDIPSGYDDLDQLLSESFDGRALFLVGNVPGQVFFNPYITDELAHHAFPCKSGTPFIISFLCATLYYLFMFNLQNITKAYYYLYFESEFSIDKIYSLTGNDYVTKSIFRLNIV